jgi:DNA modification methylase
VIHAGDCIEVMAGLEADSVDAVVTDPPYGLEFMGKEWDSPWKGKRTGVGSVGAGFSEAGDGKPWSGRPIYTGDTNPRCLNCGKLRQGGKDKPWTCVCDNPQFRNTTLPRLRAFGEWCEQWGREALRVTKPGGYLLAFGGTRTHHRLVCGLEDAGWIIRDELDWIYACLSEDTELLTREHGWVRYNRASEGDHAAAFDPATGELRWERIEHVHQYEHSTGLVEVGPSLVTLNHRVIIDEATGRVPRLPRLWDELPAGVGLGEAGRVASLLPSMQREAADTRSSIPTGPGVDRRATAVATRADDGLTESGLEGRSYRVQEAWELFGGPVRASAAVGDWDGPQGRVRDGASALDGATLRLRAHALGVRQSRESRSDRQSPREPDAVAGQPDSQAVRMGQGDRGHGLPPGDTPRLVDYAGVVWCITVPSGAFVARRNGVTFVTGNSGFPKGKANLKPAHEPIVLARKPGPLRPLAIDECRIGTDGGTRGTNYAKTGLFGIGGKADIEDIGAGRWPSNVLLSSPELFDQPNPYVVGSGATVDAQRSVRVRAGSVIGNGNTHGEFVSNRDSVGGYDDSGGYSRFFALSTTMDGRCQYCGVVNAESSSSVTTTPATPSDSTPEIVRSSGNDGTDPSAPSAGSSPEQATISTVPLSAPMWADEGSGSSGDRLPMNGSGSGSSSAFEPTTPPIPRSKRRGTSPRSASPSDPATNAEAPRTSSGTTTTTRSRWTCDACAVLVTQGFTPDGTCTGAEASHGVPADRLEHPTHLILPKADRADREPVLRPDGHEAGKRFSTHPTMKPTDLMRHLVRLVTPSGGTVLDPFLGSGSTAIACELEGFPWIGIEKEPEYVAIAEARLNGTQRGLGLDVGAPTKAPPKTHPDLSKHQPKRRAPSENYTGGWTGTDEEPAA